jgi:hypothetical protein
MDATNPGTRGSRMDRSETELADLLSALRTAENDEEVAELGRDLLAGLLRRHPDALLDKVIRLARRDNRMRNALSASRYYTGLPTTTCDRIDTFLKAPFPGAQRKVRPSRRR